MARGFTEAHPKWCVPDLIETNQCLRQLVTPLSWQWLRLHKHFQTGVMPYGGGLMDQPARFIDAMDVINDQNARS